MEEQFYVEIIKPFLKWVEVNHIQTFVDVIGDMGFVFLLPFIFVCLIKYLAKGE